MSHDYDVKVVEDWVSRFKALNDDDQINLLQEILGPKLLCEGEAPDRTKLGEEYRTMESYATKGNILKSLEPEVCRLITGKAMVEWEQAREQGEM